MATVYLHNKAPHQCTLGHCWIYDNEIGRIEGDPAPGDIVDVRLHNKAFVGRGYINPKSTIRVRLLTRAEENIDEAFFARKIEAAWDYRRRVVEESDYGRLIFGEGDFLPGLVVDKFGDVLVAQILSLGIDIRRDMVFRALRKVMNPRGIYERSDVPVREREGVEQRRGLVWGEAPDTLELRENGLRFSTNIATGQKTGFFYDQRENRRILAPFVKDAEVLDTFSYVGSFAVHAAAYGARRVTSIDISEDALASARHNAALNNVADRCEFRVANAFDELRTMSDRGTQFDTVILDPPAFAKNRGALQAALRGYKEINLRGMKMTRPGGFLVTCSCSHHVHKDEFLRMMADAARDARREIRLVELRGQARDHPIVPAVPETEYLKFAVAQVL